MPVSDIEHLVSLLFRTARLLRENARSEERFDPFSFLQLEALRYMTERGTPSMKDVARHLSMRPPSATALLNGLVRRGYVRRIADSRDRRLVRLSPTPKGRRFLERGMRQISGRMRETLALLTIGERRAMTRILERLSALYGGSSPAARSVPHAARRLR